MRYGDAAGRADGAVGSGRGRDRIGVGGKCGGDIVSSGNVGEGVRSYRPDRSAIHQNIQYLIAGIGCYGKGLAGALRYGDTAGRADGAVGSGRSVDDI